ncbi:MAG: methyltransferase [Lentisphaerae bacterium]|nr:methyltransferase [Lentisphaerota bacterium]
MLQLASGHLAAQAIHVFASLGLADILREGDRDAAELARLTACHPANLHRVLRFLTTIGVVTEIESSRFALAPLGQTLCRRPLSVIRDNTLLVASHYYWDAIGAMLHTVQTGDNAFQHVHGQSFFDHLASHSADADVFHAAMTSSSRMGVGAILASYDFSAFRQIVDVAGGQGALLTGILRKHPATRGILYDAAGAQAPGAVDATVADRLSRVSGDFFDHVPGGGDAYLLRRILHDWDDDKAVAILRQCRKAMAPEGKLLIMELAAPETAQAGNDWAAMDVLMMLMLNGRERTAADFEALLSAAGFRLARIVPTRSPYWIIESVPV